MLDTVNPQPHPQPGGQDVTALVMADLEARAKGGEAKYGTRLQTGNGRDPLIDAYQESMDITLYLRQAIAEIAEMRAENERLRATLTKIANGGSYWDAPDLYAVREMAQDALAEGGDDAPR